MENNNAEWKRTRLGKVLTFQRGFDITKKQQRPGPYAVISSSGPNSYHDQFKVRGPGVIIGRKGSLGTAFFSTSNFWPHDTTLWVKDFHGNDPKFAYYFLKTLHLENYDVGASNPTLNRNHIHKLEVSYPPLPTQRNIAAVLSAYDDLFENNTRRIQILKEMAQAIYRQWFVEFKYPGHEPVPLIDSGTELAEIPEGWEVLPLSEACNSIEDGDWIETKDQGGSDYRLLQISNIGFGQFRETGNFRHITQETFDRLNCNEVLPGDILVARMPDPIGRAWLVTAMPWRMVTAVDVAIIRINPELISRYYCLEHLNSSNILHLSDVLATGTTRPRITRRNLSKIPIAIPPNSLIQKFDDLVSKIYELSHALTKKNTNLRATRDLLLPRLVSGELDVSQLEIQ